MIWQKSVRFLRTAQPMTVFARHEHRVLPAICLPVEIAAKRARHRDASTDTSLWRPFFFIAETVSWFSRHDPVSVVTKYCWCHVLFLSPTAWLCRWLLTRLWGTTDTEEWLPSLSSQFWTCQREAESSSFFLQDITKNVEHICRICRWENGQICWSCLGYCIFTRRLWRVKNLMLLF